jgi:hypothetical protein
MSVDGPPSPEPGGDAPRADDAGERDPGEAGGAEDRGAADGSAAPDWREGLEAARTEAREEGKLVFLDLFDPG